MRLHARQIKRIALEDESRHIGKCFLPDALQKAMLVSPVVWVEEPLSSRVDRILHDYVQDLGAQFHRKHGAEDGFVAFSDRLLESLQSLQKKLGGERHASLSARMKDALRIQFDTGCVDARREWIQPLLTQYYDPMYEQNRADKASRIIFSGSLVEVTRYFVEVGALKRSTLTFVAGRLCNLSLDIFNWCLCCCFTCHGTCAINLNKICGACQCKLCSAS